MITLYSSENPTQTQASSNTTSPHYYKCSLLLFRFSHYFLNSSLLTSLIPNKPQSRKGSRGIYLLKKKKKKMQEKMKVKKGWLAVQVGLEEEDDGVKRFVIPISYLYHPLFKRLLDKAHEAYGYHANGPLRLPCSVDDFLHLRWRIERESSGSHHHHHSHHQNDNHHFHGALSFHSC